MITMVSQIGGSGNNHSMKRWMLAAVIAAAMVIASAGMGAAVEVPVSDGFDYPIGDFNGDGTYISPNGITYNGWIVKYDVTDPSYTEHTGEDWNGVGGGDTDHYQPVYAVSNGMVIYADDGGSGWGNVILIKHKLQNGTIVFSQYAHLDTILINNGDTVRRRQQIGTLGRTGLSPEQGAHLHFEMRKANMSGYSATYWPNSHGKDTQWIRDHYYDPSDHNIDRHVAPGFIDNHRPQITPLIGDWDNNNIDDTGTFNPRTSKFSWVTNPMGEPGDLPIVGDWNGDGVDTIGVYRPRTAEFFLDDDDDGYPDQPPINFGEIGDFPIVGDWDGDGNDNIGVFRSIDPITLKTTFFLKYSDGSVVPIEFGTPTDFPIIGDWNNDGEDDIGVFRRNDPQHEDNAVFYLRNGAETITIAYGRNDDIPIAGKWDSDGLTKIGVYRPSTLDFIFNHDPLVTNPSITDEQKQQEILNMVNAHRGSIPTELALAIVRQEGGEGAFHIDGWNYNSFYSESDGQWAQPTNGDGVMQVTAASGYHEMSGTYTHDRDGYDHAINDGSDYILSNYNTYGSYVQAALHYNTGPNSLYIYLGRNWGDRDYLSHVAGHLSNFIPNTYGLQTPNLVDAMNQGQNILDDYLYNRGIATGQSVDYYRTYQTQLDNDLHNIGSGRSGGPDDFGYTFTDSNIPEGPTYNWIEISGTGTEVLPNSDDSWVEDIGLGFFFNYYGTDYSQLAISNNGLLFSGVGTWQYVNQPITQTPGVHGFVAPFWDDIVTWGAGTIYYQTIGTAPHRMFVVEWYDNQHYHSSTSGVTFEAVLYEGSNNILFQYKDVDFGTVSGSTSQDRPPYNNGGSATVGIEGPTGDDGLQYSFNEQVIDPGLAIRFKFPQFAGTNLYLSKQAPASKDRGSTMTYTLHYHNFGDTAAQNVVLEDTLPAEVEFVSASDGGSYNPGTRKVTWNIGSVPANGHGYETATVKISQSVQIGTVIQNDASISTSNLEVRYDDNEAHAQTSVTGSNLPPDVSVEPNNGGTGTPSIYWHNPITFSYHSSDTATGVDISIHVNDGGPDITGSMTGGPPDWTYTTTFYPRHDRATVTYTVSGESCQAATTPTLPSTIRVLRTETGQVEVVDFKEYVKNVLPNEWISSWNMDALKAGAMAGKTYAWYWTIHQKYPGQDYDVKDTIGDQVYIPGTANSRTNQAVEETWNWLMTKNGEIFQAQYDSGTAGSPDPLNAGRMSQWGTQYWAERGKEWLWIVHNYYDPVEGPCVPSVAFDIYIDPAGYIYDADTGERIEGATVWLQWSDGEGGWENVQTGETPPISQPDENPLITGEDGQYQWDVLAGSYRVHVEASGYYPEDSIVVSIPPPVTDLHVGLTRIPVPNLPPVADADGPYTGNVGEPIAFDGTGSYDPDGTIVSYEWDLDDDGVTDDATGPTPSMTWSTPYSGIIRLAVTDEEGEIDIDETTLTVDEAEDTISPTIESITLDAYTTIPDATIHVTLEATDNVGVTSVTVDGTALVETGSVWEGDITAPSTTGDYTLTIRAEDEAGNFDETTLDYSVAIPTGGLGVAILPKVSSVSAGSILPLEIKVISTENFDDVIHVYLTTEGIPASYQADLTWFSWTATIVQIPAGGEIMLPIEVQIPLGESGPKYFFAKAESTNWNSDAKDWGRVVVTPTP